MSDKVVYEGRILEVVEITQQSGRVFEMARRAPGVRLIIPSKNRTSVLITKEHRHESGGYDYRLPGGKVFDKREEWRAFVESGGDMLEAAMQKAKAEGREEAGIEIKNLKHIVTAVNGATMEWDLYYFEVTDYEEHPEGQQLEQGEDIELQWLPIDEVKQLLFTGQMQEYRSAGVLVQWLATQGRIS